MAEYKPGDIVGLKSSGPLMTVELLPSSGIVVCIWFDHDNNLHRDRFRESLLKHIDTGVDK